MAECRRAKPCWRGPRSCTFDCKRMVWNEGNLLLLEECKLVTLGVLDLISIRCLVYSGYQIARWSLCVAYLGVFFINMCFSCDCILIVILINGTHFYQNKVHQTLEVFYYATSANVSIYEQHKKDMHNCYWNRITSFVLGTQHRSSTKVNMEKIVTNVSAGFRTRMIPIVCHSCGFLNHAVRKAVTAIQTSAVENAIVRVMHQIEISVRFMLIIGKSK